MSRSQGGCERRRESWSKRRSSAMCQASRRSRSAGLRARRSLSICPCRSRCSRGRRSWSICVAVRRRRCYAHRRAAHALLIKINRFEEAEIASASAIGVLNAFDAIVLSTHAKCVRVFVEPLTSAICKIKHHVEIDARILIPAGQVKRR